jgi:phosphate transport system substrate-binding protein
MRAALAALVLLATTFAAAIELEPPPYRVRSSIEGTIRIAGNAQAKPVLDAWERGFHREHPGARIERDLRGTDVGMASLYTGQADIVIAGRAATAPEAKAFEWIYRYRPFAVEIATGSVDRAGLSPALVAYVYADSPLERVTLAQLDAMFTRERQPGDPARLYTFDTESGTGRFFRETVLKDSRMLEWDRITELTDGAAILAALQRDRDGLAVASGPPPRGLKAIPIAGDDGVFRAATRDEVISRRYPLSRAVYAYVNRKPGDPLDATVGAFLRYALGPQGQRDVDESAAYLPLTAAMVREQLRKLDPRD